MSAFIKIAEKNGYHFEMLKATQMVNDAVRLSVVKKMEEALWTLREKTIGVWGLAFKPNTDDLRNAPSLDILKALVDGGARVQAYDPVAMDKAKEIFPDIAYADSAVSAAANVDGLLILTEWDHFKKVNLKKLKTAMKGKVVVDGRNMFRPELMAKAGFSYFSVGRPELKN